MRKELTPRKRQALEMRSKIQNTALDLFNREGFENVSVEQIAQTAGCSVGNIYHYFKSKDELVIQVTSHVDQTYLELEEQYLSDRNTPARDKLLDFVGQSLVSSVSEPVLYKAFIHAIKYPEQHILQKNDRRAARARGAVPARGQHRRGALRGRNRRGSRRSPPRNAHRMADLRGEFRHRLARPPHGRHPARRTESV